MEQKTGSLIIDVQKWIPHQNEGHQCDNAYYKECTEPIYYESVKEKLFNINNWHQLAGKEKALFFHTDKKGTIVDRCPKVGDHIKIKLPGIQNIFKDIFDWVQIIQIENITAIKDLRLLKMTLRPTKDPQTSELKTAHFLDNDATNTILLAMDKQHIQISIHGRNEKVNTFPFPYILKNIRNQIIAKTGFIGLNSIQWQCFVEGLLDKKNK